MRRFPPGPGRGFGREGPDDYDEELRAFSRKREREKRRRQTTSTESADSNSEKDEDGDTGKKRKSSKGREKEKKPVKKIKKDLSDEGSMFILLYEPAPVQNCLHMQVKLEVKVKIIMKRLASRPQRSPEISEKS